MKSGWIGFDFDGTLVQDVGESGEYDGSIGPPIPAMVELAKRYIAAGYEVRIVTARAATLNDLCRVKKWAIENLGKPVEVTNKKDYAMLLLYDDRAIAVEKNTGRTAGFRQILGANDAN